MTITPGFLANKTALITGSSRGIGLAAAEEYVKQGAEVIVSSEQTLDKAIEKVSGTPTADLRNAEVNRLINLLNTGKAHYVQADISEPNGIEKLITEAWKKLKTIDILVNNAGIYNEPSFLDISWENFLKVFKINFWAPLKLAQEFVRKRIDEGKGKGGRLLFTTSINAERSEPQHTLYDASKAALGGLIRQLSVELAPQKFTTMGIAAGLHETNATDYGLRSDPAAREAINSQIPLGIGSAQDVGPWLAFAGSDAARYATGTIINVDGGISPLQLPVRPITAAENSVATAA